MNPFVLMAGGGSQEAGSMYTTLVTFVLIILIFYFLIIRPQKKRDKEAKKMLEAMKKGDKVVSIGGIHGTIVQVKDQTVVVKVDDSARIEFTKSAIASVVSKDKSAPQKVKKEEEKAAEVAEEKKEEVKPELVLDKGEDTVEEKKVQT